MSGSVPKRAVLLLNTRAGTLLKRPELPGMIEEALRRSGLALRVIGEGEAADLGGRLDLAVADGAELVIVGGGDGTLRSAAARLAGTGRTLGVLPMGTLNLLAKDLNMPRVPAEGAEARGRAAPRRLAQGGGCPPPRRGGGRARPRGDRSLLARIRVVVGTIRSMGHPPLRLALVEPGRPRPRRVWARALSVVNNPYAEEVGSMFRRPRLDGGILAVYRPRGFGLLWTARMLAAMALGRWRDTERLEITHLPSLTIRSRRDHLRVANDGEMLILSTPLEYRVRPRALRVLSVPVGGTT